MSILVDFLGRMTAMPLTKELSDELRATLVPTTDDSTLADTIRRQLDSGADPLERLRGPVYDWTPFDGEAGGMDLDWVQSHLAHVDPFRRLMATLTRILSTSTLGRTQPVDPTRPPPHDDYKAHYMVCFSPRTLTLRLPPASPEAREGAEVPVYMSRYLQLFDVSRSENPRAFMHWPNHSWVGLTGRAQVAATIESPTSSMVAAFQHTGTVMPMDLDALSAQQRWESLGTPVNDWWSRRLMAAGSNPMADLPYYPDNVDKINRLCRQEMLARAPATGALATALGKRLRYPAEDIVEHVRLPVFFLNISCGAILCALAHGGP